LAICARMVPNAGLRVSWSDVTRTSLPSTATVVPASTTCCSSALAPFTRTVPPPTVTVTPDGIGTGFLPTLDISLLPLPDLADDFAAETRLAGLAVGQEPARRGHDRDPEPAHDARNAHLGYVDAAAGGAHPLDAADHALLVARVLEIHAQRALARVLDDLEV